MRVNSIQFNNFTQRKTNRRALNSPTTAQNTYMSNGNLSFGMAKLNSGGITLINRLPEVMLKANRFIEDFSNAITKRDEGLLSNLIKDLANEEEMVKEKVFLYQNKENGRSLLCEMLDKKLEKSPIEYLDAVNTVGNSKAKAQFHLFQDNGGQSHLYTALDKGQIGFAEKYLDSVNKLEDKNAIAQFHLLQTQSGRSHLYTALDNGQIGFAKKYLDSVNKLKDKKAIAQFHLLQTQSGRSHLYPALDNGQAGFGFSFAEAYLQKTALAVPKAFKHLEIPLKLKEGQAFMDFGKIIARHEDLSKAETLKILRKHNTNGVLDDYIRIVETSAE
ncbi:MAG: hypothetical protein WCY19_07420 [Candidatus Gastranaerophilaceae bacterium]